MKTILVPTDFSDEAKNALDFAVQLARKTDAEVHLYHIVEHPSIPTFDTTGSGDIPDVMDDVYFIKLVEQAQKQLKEVAKSYDPVNIITKTDLGNPFVRITEKIADSHVDLIVMGTKGASGLQEIFIGSNTERVVRNASCPVVTLSNPCDMSRIKRIAYPTNFADDDEELLGKVKVLQELFEATLHVVKINTPHSYIDNKVFNEKVSGLIEKNGIADYEVHIYNAFNEEEGIVFFCDEFEIDFIVMATHGRKGFMHFFLGSVAEDVVNHSPIPVWTYKIV
jgi:nucleotide-binding universal stress UspA family protein